MTVFETKQFENDLLEQGFKPGFWDYMYYGRYVREWEMKYRKKVIFCIQWDDGAGECGFEGPFHKADGAPVKRFWEGHPRAGRFFTCIEK